MTSFDRSAIVCVIFDTVHCFVYFVICSIYDHQVRDSDPKDSKRERIVHLIEDFRISGASGERILWGTSVKPHNVLL